MPALIQANRLSIYFRDEEGPRVEPDRNLFELVRHDAEPAFTAEPNPYDLLPNVHPGVPGHGQVVLQKLVLVAIKDKAYAVRMKGSTRRVVYLPMSDAAILTPCPYAKASQIGDVVDFRVKVWLYRKIRIAL